MAGKSFSQKITFIMWPTIHLDVVIFLVLFSSIWINENQDDNKVYRFWTVFFFFHSTSFVGIIFASS